MSHFDNSLQNQTEYQTCLGKVGLKLNQALAKSLGLDENYFDPNFTKPMLFVRLLHYSAVKSCPEEGVFGAGFTFFFSIENKTKRKGRKEGSPMEEF